MRAHVVGTHRVWCRRTASQRAAAGCWDDLVVGAAPAAGTGAQRLLGGRLALSPRARTSGARDPRRGSVPGRGCETDRVCGRCPARTPPAFRMICRSFLRRRLRRPGCLPGALRGPSGGLPGAFRAGSERPVVLTPGQHLRAVTPRTEHERRHERTVPLDRRDRTARRAFSARSVRRDPAWRTARDAALWPAPNPHRGLRCLARCLHRPAAAATSAHDLTAPAATGHSGG